MTSNPHDVLTRTLAGMATGEHDRLLPDAESRQLPATVIGDPAWMDEQIRLRGLMWGTDDTRVLATLWWYSAPTRLIAPSVASFVVTGEVLSPHLDDLQLHWRADSRLTAVTSAIVLTGDSPLDALAGALRETFDSVIEAVVSTGRVRRPPLWAIATDAIAGSLLWAGRAHGAPERATALARPLVAALGAPMPSPRYGEVTSRAGGSRLVTRRVSCCLLYRAPGEDRCTSCPNRPPAERLALLRDADA